MIPLETKNPLMVQGVQDLITLFHPGQEKKPGEEA
jgi:hypothetical protein